MLFTSTSTRDYGFLEDTLAMTATRWTRSCCSTSHLPGCLINCGHRMFRMRDEMAMTTRCCACRPGPPDEHAGHPSRAEFQRLEIQHFFEVYKAIEPASR